MLKKISTIIILLLVLLSSVVVAISASTNDIPAEKKPQFQGEQGYYNITVFETWDKLNSTSGDKPVLIDVRRIEEYLTERIKTPYPEDWPRWFPYQYKAYELGGAIINQGILLQIFIRYFDGQDIILYCRTANRTTSAAEILVANGYNGTVYNMLGGIVEWKQAGLPIS
jgi:rhodanese-related sulfurtransferase